MLRELRFWMIGRLPSSGSGVAFWPDQVRDEGVALVEGFTGPCRVCTMWYEGDQPAYKISISSAQQLQGTHEMGVSENRGTFFWGPYNKDPTI